MTKINPSFEKIQKMKVQPTAGELHLLHMLDSVLNDEFEVYFNPYINGDRPDVVIFHPTRGILIIEVKDWDLNLYELDERKHWKLKYPKDGGEYSAVLKSPISQALKYKKNLYELHIDHLLELKINDIRNFNFVSCAVYFHKASKNQINKMLVEPFKNDRKYRHVLKWDIDLISHDNLEKEIKKCLHMKWLDRDSHLGLFTKEIADNIKRFLMPTNHMKADGKIITYDKRQNEIIYSPRKEMRIKGVMGSGKTTILAKKAAFFANKKKDAKVLILSYNITLKNYIHDKISSVSENFSWGQFTINNYHEFINSQLNNLGINVSVPTSTDDLEENFSSYLEQNYYGNTSLFEEFKDRTERYDAIFIDEIQDYHRSWMDIIKKYFKTAEGQYILFGDVKQNIYSNNTNGKDVITNVIGKPIELKKCYRSQFKVRELAICFQKEIFKEKYDIDTFDKQSAGSSPTLDFDYNLKGYINYIHLQDTYTTTSLYNIIRGNIENKEKNINPNDITILGYTIPALKEFDAYYRYKSHEKTTTMFETYEIMFLQHLNYFNEQKASTWYRLILNQAKGGSKRMDNNDKKWNAKIALALTAYHLYTCYPESFKILFESKCKVINCSSTRFEEIIKQHKKEYDQFKNEVFSDDYEYIRKNKKLHFWMNTGCIKISTIHSFKGWESQVIFLILEKKNNYSHSYDEILYTAITRSKSDLVIINYGNIEYDSRIKSLIEKIH